MVNPEDTAATPLPDSAELAFDTQPAWEHDVEEAGRPGSLADIQVRLQELQSEGFRDPDKLLEEIMGKETSIRVKHEYWASDSEVAMGTYFQAFLEEHYPDRAHELADLYADNIHKNAERERLEREALPFIDQEIRTQMEAMADTTDWRRAFRGDKNDWADTLRVAREYQASKHLTGKYQHDLERLAQLKDFADKFRLERPEVTLASKQPDIEPHEWLATNTRAMKMLSPERRNKMLNREFNLALVSLSEPHRRGELSVGPGLPQSLDAALRYQFAEAARRFDQADVDVLKNEHLDAVKKNRAPFISGTGALADVLGFDDQHEAREWVQKRIDQVPQEWTTGLGFLQFRHELGTFTLNGKQHIEAGHYKSNENVARVKPDASLPSPSDRFETAEKIYHEVAHDAHMKRLSIADLREWIDVVSSEVVNLTEYIEDNRSDAKRQENGGADDEDFADTFAAFMVSPGYVLLETPRRFEYFNQRTGRYKVLEHATAAARLPEAKDDYLLIITLSKELLAQTDDKDLTLL